MLCRSRYREIGSQDFALAVGPTATKTRLSACGWFLFWWPFSARSSIGNFLAVSVGVTVPQSVGDFRIVASSALSVKDARS